MKIKFIISILSFMMTFSLQALAQSSKVKGTVVDENGEPVIGATVRVVGTKAATITDLDGNYSIDLPKGGKMTVSYIGYEDTTTTGGKLQLKPNQTDLQEVVVVGYGSQKKAHLTGSVATVPVDEIQDLSSSGLASTLSGLVNGLSVNGGESRPGESASIYVRGTSSLGDIGSTAQQPLFVIDGYIYPNDIKVGNTTQNLGAEAFNNLDPSEVESITVLKDASAAVYGARAANGVILVTTKKGKKGEPVISYSGTFGFADEVDRTKMLSAYDYGRLYNASVAADFEKFANRNATTDYFQADELEAMKGLNYDLLDANWKTATTMKHSVNVSGATDKVNYFAGVSYFEQDGNLGKLDYNRWNYRAGVDVKVSQWLSANLTVSGDYGKKNQPLIKVGGSGDDYNRLLTRPYYIPEYVGGNAIPAYGISNNEVNQAQSYAYDVLQNNGDYKRNMNSNSNINASFEYDFGWSKILKGLKMKFNYSKSINTDKGNEYGSGYNLYQMIRRYGSGMHLYTPTTGDIDGFDYLDASNFTKLTKANGDYLSRSMTRTDNYQMNFTVNYARDFGQHHISGLFSIERSEAESEYLTGQRNTPYPFTTGQYNSATGEMTTTFTRSEGATLSYIGRVNYAFANKYLLEALFRRDSSPTKFGPKNKWANFPAFSAGWVVSEEKWFHDALPWVDFLKLRASWGLTGRDNCAAWQWMQVYAMDANRGTVFGEGVSNNSGNRITINKNNSAVNNAVHWDKVYKTNIGLDFQVLNSRLNVGLEYYYERNREMLMNIKQTVPSTVGTQSASSNLGEMDSWGFELSLKWRDKIGQDFKYHVGINTGYSDNKVLNMNWETNYMYRQIQYGKRTDQGLWGMQCIGMFRSFQDIEEYFKENNITLYMGKTKDKVYPGMLIYKDVRGDYDETTGTYAGPDGIVDKENDQVRLSNRSNPYGFTTNFGAEWKGLSISAQISASWGGYTTLPSAALKPASGFSLETSNMPAFWNPDNMYTYQDVYDGSGKLIVKANQDGMYPNIAYSDVNAIESSFWRVSATRVTLNRLTIAYSLPKAWFGNIGIKSARVNVTGQNLINFYNPYPEGLANPMAGSFGGYPVLRKFTVGVNLSF